MCAGNWTSAEFQRCEELSCFPRPLIDIVWDLGLIMPAAAGNRLLAFLGMVVDRIM